MQGIVKVKDVIARIDGVAIQGLEYNEVLSKFKAIPTGQGVRLRLVRREESGPERRSSVEYAAPTYDQGWARPTDPESASTVFDSEISEADMAKITETDGSGKEGEADEGGVELSL